MFIHTYIALHQSPTSTPYTLHPTLYTLHPTPYTLVPKPGCSYVYTYIYSPTPKPNIYTLHPTPNPLHPTPYTLVPTPGCSYVYTRVFPRQSTDTIKRVYRFQNVNPRLFLHVFDRHAPPFFVLGGGGVCAHARGLAETVRL